MPATAALSGMPASISARLAPQTEAIDEDPFDSRMSRNHTQRVRRLIFSRQNGGDRALRQRSVAHFAAANAGHTAGLAHRERRKIVVQHEPLPLLALKRLQPL